MFIVDERYLVAVDIRGTNNEGILQRLREAVEGLVERVATAAPTAAE
ncbi:MAG: hypothetical protein HY908_21155 [Myxococcales bacterium]|nr:hypothetical protein [Myxococcales bacterium]